MESKIINSMGQTVYETPGGIGYLNRYWAKDTGYTYGYWVCIRDMSLLTKNNDEDGGCGFSKYHGGRYTLVEVQHGDDKICDCCGQNLPEDQIVEINDTEEVVITKVVAEGVHGYNNVCFSPLPK